MINFTEIKDRKDYLSVDKLIAISAEGSIFHIGDIVKHESQEDETATIQSFLLDRDSMDVIAQTNLGTARICFLYK
jgi:hypothetical protein